jgi:hypothetical protein
LNPPAPKKSRVWSSAITIMTRPRKRSMELRRGWPAAFANVSGTLLTAVPPCGGVTRNNASDVKFARGCLSWLFACATPAEFTFRCSITLIIHSFSITLGRTSRARWQDTEQRIWALRRPLGRLQ